MDRRQGPGMDWKDPEIAGYAAVSGGRIWYRMNGSARDGAPVVGITGGPGMSHHYMLPLTALADARPVVLYDQLDTGNADRPGDPANWTVARYVAEIEALRAALGRERLILAGHSWGGLLAYEYALAHPDRIAGLLLLSPCLSAARWVEDCRLLIAGLPRYLQAIIADCEARGAYADEGYLHAEKEFTARHVRRIDPRPPELARSAAEFAGNLYNHIWGPSEFTPTGVIRDYDGLPRIGALKAPVLFLCGEHDEARPETMRDFAAMVPGSEVAVIPGASHLTFNERTEAFLSAVRDFLGRRLG